MATIVELSLPATEFPLGRLLTAGTETQIEFERIVPVGTNAIPLFWAWNTDLDDFERRVRAHEQVLELLEVEEVDNRRLYLLNWDVPEGGFFEGFTAAETIIRSAYGYDTEAWEFEILFPDQEELTIFHNHCRENDIQYTLGQMHTLTEAGDHLLEDVLTEKQRDALLLALQRGYFQTPRQVTLSELAEEFDISQQSLSDLIRRGNEALLEHALLNASETTPPE
ncbi:Predicted DNA binding protein, contains HTH domain [Haladaptatus litoreus]|uniref:Predicted DNA binding protein, contains HTH domain n=1 Tax=Haladaptatus litoreus TaxID=553468 RepID=A0A1N7EFT8_9EURY|nr:helix-turn-helix domain-containing protein [Haladaptatus litoreus]SIR86946.1 Predicted DNA binding protein, contains HTH domain [Haladaptatus litoreus]